jgi:hypothetical protein
LLTDLNIGNDVDDDDDDRKIDAFRKETLDDKLFFFEVKEKDEGKQSDSSSNVSMLINS